MVSVMKNGICSALSALLVSSALLVASATHAQTTVEYIHTDALGTPVAVTDATGTVIERSEYEPYGQLVNRPPTDGPGFTGHVQDAATGLTYMQQRYYDPVIGRFLSVDPVTAYSSPGANFNRYWYANNNPYKFTDPDGRQSKEDVKAPSVGVPLLDRLWTPSDARDSTGQMMERQLGFEMSLPMSAKDIVLNIAVAMSLGTGAAGGVANRGAVGGMARSGTSSVATTEVVQRGMSRAELGATKSTGLLRGGRDGTHYVSDAVNSDALRARQRLALPQTPEVRATLEVPAGRFSSPSRVDPAYNMPGGGMERTATGEVPVRILKIDEYRGR